MRISWMIGGAQGSGVDTSANVFGNALASLGFYIYGNREYYSNIKGRHSYFNLTISDTRARSISNKVDILASFDAETIFHHFTDVTKFAIYNVDLVNTPLLNVQSIEPEVAERVGKVLEEKGLEKSVSGALKYMESNGVKLIPVDYDEVMKEVASKLKVPLSVAERAKNTTAIAVSYALLGLPKENLLKAIEKTFKQETFVKLNGIAVEAAFSRVKPELSLSPPGNTRRRVIVDGNTAVAMGKIYGGLEFQSYYPITPASDESTYIEAHQEVWYIDPTTGDKRKRTIVVVQAEDELAAINMASAAALTGARSATATSGPGFSLMAEGIGWAGMNEVPVVVTFYMRGGPSTGLPTRTSQADLKFALNVGHGEFPKIVIASGDHVEAFQDAVWAFNLAERYQTPVIHLVEKALANAYSIIDVEELELEKIKIDRGKLAMPSSYFYQRFTFTEDGISPRAFLGDAYMFYTGDEHNVVGHISEEPLNRTKMYQKRMKKLETADREIPEEERLKVFGEESKVAVVTWGSPKGAVLDAVEELGKEGIKVQVIQLRVFSPFPSRLLRKLLDGKEVIIDVEGNYEGQAGEVIKEKTGIEPTHYVLKWNGRPMARDEVKEGLIKALNGERKVILNGGA